MPSVVVHIAFAGLLGTALLGEEFDAKAIFVVMFTRGTTKETSYSTGFNPTPGESSSGAERSFPIAETGELFVLTVTSFLTVAYRIIETELNNEEP